MPVQAAANSKLPVRPPIPTPLQTAIWALRLEFMDRREDRYGETFTLRVVRRPPWALSTNPRHVKAVFARASELMGAGAGEANPLLTPLLSARRLAPMLARG